MNTHLLPASVKNLAAELETLHVQLGGDPGEYVAEPGYAPVCEVGDTDPEMIERLAQFHALILLAEDDCDLQDEEYKEYAFDRQELLSWNYLPRHKECAQLDAATSSQRRAAGGKSMAEIVGEALAWVWSLERQITAIVEELRRQNFFEIDTLQEMGCDPEAIEAARGVVTVEPNYDTDDDGLTIDIVTVDGRRFRRAHELDPDMPMRWSERRENEQIWQLWAASIGGTIIKG